MKKERFMQGLRAMAICDAVGADFEFEYDPDPIEVMQYANGGDYDGFTDDTQMTLFMTEAIVRNHLGSDFHTSMIRELISWWGTQRREEFSSNLSKFKSLYKVRTPGTTCMESCSAHYHERSVENDSKGCGSVMRCLPFVLYPESVATECAIRSARLTHLHEETDVAVRKLMKFYFDILNDRELERVAGDSIESAGNDEGGWTSLSAVDMAIYAFHKAKTFDELLTISICHDGDSDSVAAIAGSMWGVAGREVPSKYYDSLPSGEREVIQYMENRIETIQSVA